MLKSVARPSRVLWKMQLFIWLVFYLFLFLYNSQRWEHLLIGFYSTSIAICFYLTAVYTNSSFLIPSFYERKKWYYFIFSLFFLTALFLTRVFAEYGLLYSFHPQLYGLTAYHFTFSFLTNGLAFLFGAFLYNTIAYSFLLRKQDELLAYQANAELNLLKSQVQPHFLFNTLNNIYYLAYTNSAKTTEVISKLSDMMRYFLDEAPKERVLLSAELCFLQNYIQLESIRMLHPIDLNFLIGEFYTETTLPPMLLIPLLENVFKHGVDKTLQDNPVSIKFYRNEDYFFFVTENNIYHQTDKPGSGLGLINLRKRLELLYPGNFELIISSNHKFVTTLKFPL